MHLSGLLLAHAKFCRDAWYVRGYAVGRQSSPNVASGLEHHGFFVVAVDRDDIFCNPHEQSELRSQAVVSFEFCDSFFLESRSASKLVKADEQFQPR